MSGERKRYRWRRSPLLIEENLIINSKSTSTTTTTRTEEEKHTNNIRRKWFSQDEGDDDDDEEENRRPTESIAEKIDRVLKKINAWTNETSINNSNQNNHDEIFTRKHAETYDNIQKKSNTFRRRCSSSTYDDTSELKYDQRPYSVAFINDPLPMSIVNPYRRSFYDKSRKSFQHQSMFSPQTTNLKSLSSMYGSDFFYPADQDQHEYDNLSSIQKSAQQQQQQQPIEPFPTTIVVDCQRCSRSVDRSSSRDISCQVPSDDELYQDLHFQTRQTSRSSPVYISPRSSPPPPFNHPPNADTLLAPYHSRRKHSLSSYVSMHNRSKSVPSSSSSMTSRKARLPPSLSPLPPACQSQSAPSTNTLLRSIKTSIHAMKKRLKDIRRLSEDSNVTTVLDDYTARSSQELSVSKGQHVRILQKQPSNAPDWCLIRLLNDHHQQQSNSSSTTGSIDLPISKYIEGLVPAIILKSTKSPLTATNQLPPPLSLSQTEQNGSLGSLVDESKQRPSTSTQSSKRRSSFRRILKNPARRLSLKDKPLNSDELITTDIIDGTIVNPRHASSSNLNTTRKLKAYTFINTDDLTSLPDDTNSTSKSIDGLYKMTDSSPSTSTTTTTTTTILSPRNDFETDTDKIPSPSSSSSLFDIRSSYKSSIDTNTNSSSNAPINIVSGFSASDFHIPTALSITTPSVDDTSIASMPTSSSSSTITVMPNNNPSEIPDEISLNDTDQATLSSLTTVTTDEPIDDRTKYGAKRRHNIIELIETEKEYVKDLALIVEGYMNIIENDKEIKKPTGLVGRERVVFGNVQRIYEFHRDTFLPKLEQCIENPDILGGLFTTNRFNPYVRYCENKPRSEYIVSEYHDYFEEIRKKLGQKLLVSDLLIKPVQRIMRYQLLLKEILKSTERMGDQSNAIRSALKVMIEVPQQANDMMNVGRIKDLPTNVHQLGELKLQDMLMVSEPMLSKDVEKKFKERRVFLFQQSMIFCDEIPAKDKYSSPNYIYKYELKINKLQHKEFKHNKDLFQFTLVEVDAGNTRRVTCQCKDQEQYELWVTSANKVLQRQMDLIIALTNPTAALQKDPRSK